MGINVVIKLFQRNNVIVFGVKGSGKDLLTGNVAVRRSLPYSSNVDYGGDYYPLDLPKLDLNGNIYRNFLDGDIRPYLHPLPEMCDIYISDAGIYFPAQYNGELNKRYPTYAALQALLRHLNDSALHVNVQALNRVWDKIREQADQYILCRWCHVFFKKIVMQRITVYEDYDAALKKVRPCRISVPWIGHKTEARIARDRFRQQFGIVKNRFLIYINKSTYDTRIFREILSGSKSSPFHDKAKAVKRKL